MYQIDSTAVVNRIESDSRTFRAMLIFPEANLIYSGADVGRFTAEHAQSEDDSLQIGAVLSRHLEIRLYTDTIPRRGAVFRLYLYLLDWNGTASSQATYAELMKWRHGELAALTHAQISRLGQTKDKDGTVLDGVYIPMGEFVVRRAAVQGVETVLDCYDKLYGDAAYTPSVSFPANSEDVVDDAISQLGIPGRRAVSGGYLKTALGEYVLTASGERVRTASEYSFTIQTAPAAGTTCREVLGWIAAMRGGCGITDRDGLYTTLLTKRSSQRMLPTHTDTPELEDTSGVSAANRWMYVRGMVCEVDEETTLTAGTVEEDDPHTVVFACPYMTQARLDALCSRMAGVSWRAGRVKERLGDPRRDLGDLVRPPYPCRDTLLISGLTYQFDGGLSAEIESCGNEEVYYG